MALLGRMRLGAELAPLVPLPSPCHLEHETPLLADPLDRVVGGPHGAPLDTGYRFGHHHHLWGGCYSGTWRPILVARVPVPNSWEAPWGNRIA